jgi:cytochrome c
MMKTALLGLGATCAVVLYGGVSAAAGLADGDAAHGEELYKKCAVCHSLAPGEKKIGPSLHGMWGREAGTLDGFSFSFAMKLSKIVWDEATLNEYLKNPTMFIPGARMLTGGVASETDRRDLLAYLKQATTSQAATTEAPKAEATTTPAATTEAPKAEAIK